MKMNYWCRGGFHTWFEVAQALNSVTDYKTFHCNLEMIEPKCQERAELEDKSKLMAGWLYLFQLKLLTLAKVKVQNILGLSFILFG